MGYLFVCEERQSERVTSVCLCYSLVLCIRVSDVMLLAGEIWCNGGRGTQLVDMRERERHICLSECRQPPLLSLLSSSGLFSLRHCVMEETGGSGALLRH